MVNPIDYWYKKYLSLKAEIDEMMKDAMVVEVGMRGDPIEIILDKYVQRAMGIFPGDKVRIVVIPNKDEK